MIRVRGLEQKQTRNRSSKHLKVLTGFKPGLWSMNATEVAELAKTVGDSKGGNMYEEELQRRQNCAAKRKTPRPACPKKPEASKKKS